MLIITATIVRRAKRINSDIQIIDILSDDPADWSATESPGDELAEMVTTVLTVAVLVTDCTSVLVVMVVDVTVDVMVSVTAQVPVRVKCSIR